MPRRRPVRLAQPEPRPLVPAEALARLGELSEKEMGGTQLPHPAHGPIEALPRDAQGFIPAYYFRSPHEIDEEGLGPPEGLRPGMAMSSSALGRWMPRGDVVSMLSMLKLAGARRA
jgi:hypothetical protein